MVVLDNDDGEGVTEAEVGAVVGPADDVRIVDCIVGLLEGLLKKMLEGLLEGLTDDGKMLEGT